MLCAKDASITIKLSDYTVTVVEKKLSNGAILDLSYSPYLFYKHLNMETHRYVAPKDPLGPRTDWAYIPNYPLKGWADYADLMKAEDFHITLSSTSADNWSRLMKVDKLVLEYLIRNTFKDFISRNSGTFSQTINDLREKLGPVIEYAFFNESKLNKKDQYAFEEAFKILDNRSALFKPQARLDKTFLEFNFLPSMDKQITWLAPINQHPLIVVHASTDFDKSSMAKTGIDHEVSKFKAAGLPVIYLVNHDGVADLTWYPQDRNPSFALYSAGGEHNLPLYNASVTIVGGFFGDYDDARGCHFKAMADAITRYYLHGKSPFKIYLPISAIYFARDDMDTRDGFIANEISSEEFIKYVHDLLFFTGDVAQTHLGGSTEYTGVISISDYTFLYFVNDELIKTHGHGPRQVEFHFSLGE